MSDFTVDYQTHPSQYRHWSLKVEGEVATLSLDIQEDGGILPGYKLKLNSCATCYGGVDTNKLTIDIDQWSA